MSQEYYSIITNSGLAKHAASSLGGTPLDLTHLAVGDSNGTPYNPVATATALQNERHRVPVTYVVIDAENPHQLIIEAIIDETIGPFYIREVGIFDADGDLFAIGKFPETFKPNLPSGSGKRLYVRMILGFASAPQVNLLLSDNLNYDPNFSDNVFDALAEKLDKAENLADLENTQEARDNLGLKNGALTDLTGAVMAFAMTIPLTGWLECNGAAISRTIYAKLFTAIGITFGSGDGVATFNLPDLRGNFIRGWANTGTIDNGRSFGSIQNDAFQGHQHSAISKDGLGGIGFFAYANGVTQPAPVSTTAIVADGSNGTPRTASETRPRNLALIYCIKY